MAETTRSLSIPSRRGCCGSTLRAAACFGAPLPPLRRPVVAGQSCLRFGRAAGLARCGRLSRSNPPADSRARAAILQVVRLTLKSLRAGIGPLSGEVALRPGERDVLNPLFVLLRDRRALLEPTSTRYADMAYITQSVKDVREALTEALGKLGPNAEARVWLEKLRAACREFLTAAESEQYANAEWVEFQPALVQPRSAFREVANHVAAYYRLPAARELADEMARNSDT
jgi:hypothetical protein